MLHRAAKEVSSEVQADDYLLTGVKSSKNNKNESQQAQHLQVSTTSTYLANLLLWNFKLFLC